MEEKIDTAILDKERKEKALELAEKLELPESIRTPGRTWTRYSKLDEELGDIDLKPIEPGIEVEGDADVFTGKEALEEAGDKLLDAIKMDENRVNALHAAYMNSLVYIDAGDSKIRITYDEESPVLAHLVVDTRRSSEVSITEEFHGEPGLLTSFDEFYLGGNSSLSYGAVESAEGLTYSSRKAITGRDSRMNWLNSIFEGQLSRTSIETVLKGDNSETEKIGVWYPTGEQHTDISLKVYHIGDNTRCDMNSRAVVDDKARSIYEGLQDVGDKADDTSSFQREQVLMLSDDAEVDASPKLMIENPDVKASHAASAGNLPKDKVHYLESRGLSRRKAERLIVKGFFEPVMESIELPELKESIRKEVQKKLDE
ncbi:MAG: SufD family Fe-S cluster assembly protein [Candidatus Nanohaloarchaea archaeon]